MATPPVTDTCGVYYPLSVSVQRPLACDLAPNHPDEHRARTPDGDVYWRKT